MSRSLTLIRELCSRIVVVGESAATSPKDSNSVLCFAERLARIQGSAAAKVALKGMALFAADPPQSAVTSRELREWLGQEGTLHALSAHCDVKWLVADVGLQEDYSTAPFGTQVLPQLLKRISAEPGQAVWDAMHEGVRLACRMKGRGTDIFGVCFLPSYELAPSSAEALADMKAWPIAAAAGFLLAAVDLQTPVVVSGTAALAAVAVAQSLAPAVSGYILLAQPADNCPVQIGFEPLLTWKAPDPLAVILGLDFCQSAAMFHKR